MTKRMLVDATHPEETRVAIVDERRLEDFDFESTGKKQLKGNIYLAKVIRVEPSLQAAFVEYGGNRHGFLPFTEIHPDYFRIPMADRPHDEDLDDELDESEETNEAIEAEVKAYRNEIEHEQEHHHNLDAVQPQIEMPGEPMGESMGPMGEQGAQAEMMTVDRVSIEVSAAGDTIMASDGHSSSDINMPQGHDGHVVGLGPEQSGELGLITDFGNAATDAHAFESAPLEIVGGEVAEVEVEEERIRRPRPPRYKIQEVVKRRQIMLIQVVKEERGNKGAALTTFLSLAGRYCVLMPNTDRGGGVSRKITSHTDRRRMKEILDQLETPEGMAVILRTAGMEQEPAEIQRDLEHLLRLWNNIREQTLQSTAPTLIYEEANLIKRSMRDLYSADVSEILVSGTKGYQLAYEFMRSIMPEDLGKVRQYEDAVPLFFRYNVEKQIDQLYNPVVQLRSGGYIVINPTEALVSIDVNSGRSTRERHIEGTALKTNLEAADETARQLRLRDLAGLVVIDFIDMEDGRNNAAVERRMKEAMKADRARLQIGRISPFGLLELSRQRLHPSLTEINFEKCPHCAGIGLQRSVDSSAISILRMIEEDGIRQQGGEMILHVPTKVALYILNQKRSTLHEIERRYNLTVLLHSDDTLVPPDCKMERVRAGGGERISRGPAVDSDQILANVDRIDSEEAVSADPGEFHPSAPRPEGERQPRRRGRFGRGGRDRNDRGGERPERTDRPDRNRERPASVPGEERGALEVNGNTAPSAEFDPENIGNTIPPEAIDPNGNAPGFNPDGPRQEGHRQGGRRRGRRGGRGRRSGQNGERPEGQPVDGEVLADGSPAPRQDRQPSERQPGERPQGDRPRGDRQRRPDNRGPREGSNNNRDQGPRDGNRRPERMDRPEPNANIAIPVSIHDLDTTPRPPRVQESYIPSGVSQSMPPKTAAAPPPSPYEVTNESPDKPKGGWWRKLTGQ